MAKKKWIQGAIKREGRTTRYCKRKGYKGVNKKCLEEMKKAAKRKKDKSLMGAAILAERFKYGDLKKKKRKRK